MNYKKMWDTLKAEAGSSIELRIVALMDEMEDRALEEKITTDNSDYAKCVDDIMKLFDVDYPNKSAIEWTLKKHFT